MAEICVARGGEPSSHAMVEMHNAHRPSNLGRAENGAVAVFSPFDENSKHAHCAGSIRRGFSFAHQPQIVELAMGRGMLG
jgi:hypothetical protein